MTEFDLIYKLINTQSVNRADVLTGIGDDCAILSVPDGYSLAVSMDTLVVGVHFPESATAFSIGYKSLAVNLSDLAATGAIPAWITLSLTLPSADEKWLRDFVKGLFTLANKYKVQLVGGDMTSGPLSVSIQAHGFVKDALLRSGAKPGNLIFVSGTVGDASLGLRSYNGEENISESCIQKFNQPEPQIKLGQALSAFATSCIDISDGLISDLGHICQQSHCGAEIFFKDIPVSVDYKSYFNQQPDCINAISFGDDYELCFTINLKDTEKVIQVSKETGVDLTCIGKITASGSMQYFDQDNKPVKIMQKGFEHFR